MIYYLLIFLLFAAFMFWMQRKQRQAQAKVESMQKALQVGDQVVTVSGLYGTVVEVDETTVDLEIAEDVVTTWLRQSIREVRAADHNGGEHGSVAVEQTGDADPAQAQPAAADELGHAAPATNGAQPAAAEHRGESDKD